MEDYEFITRRRRSGRIVIADCAVRTSARRWESLGAFRATLVNQIVVLGYNMGVGCERLARYYRKHATGPRRAVSPFRRALQRLVFH